VQDASLCARRTLEQDQELFGPECTRCSPLWPSFVLFRPLSSSFVLFRSLLPGILSGSPIHFIDPDCTRCYWQSPFWPSFDLFGPLWSSLVLFRPLRLSSDASPCVLKCARWPCTAHPNPQGGVLNTSRSYLVKFVPAAAHFGPLSSSFVLFGPPTSQAVKHLLFDEKADIRSPQLWHRHCRFLLCL